MLVEHGDVAYVLAAANGAFPDAKLTEDDVVSTWAGLRPLVRPPRLASPSATSRDYRLFRSPSGLVSVAGGKLTAFRAMAESIVDQLLPGSRSPESRRASLAPLPGAEGPQPSDADWRRLAELSGLQPALLREWSGVYGTDVGEVAACLPNEQSGDAALDWHRAMTRYAVEQEMAQRVEDVYVRRTGLMLFSQDNWRQWLEPLAAEMAGLLDWSRERTSAEIIRTAAASDRMFAFRSEAGVPTVPIGTSRS